MKDRIKNLMTSDQFNGLKNALLLSNYEGVGDDVLESLFTYGFIYDVDNGVVITTHTIGIYERVGEVPRFGVKKISLSELDEKYESNKELILENCEITSGEWACIHPVHKIQELQLDGDTMILSNITKNMDISEVIEYILD